MVLKRIRVLLVEDHEVVRKGLRLLLEATPGIEVVAEARDGMEGWRKACGLRPDVVVLDLSLPRLEGAAVAERIRDDCPGVGVLVLTAHEDRGHLTRLLEAGAAGYMLKRSTADELVRAVRLVAEGGSWVDPVLASRVLRWRSTRPGAAVPPGSAQVLSEREEQVVRKIAWGHSNKEVGELLGISTRTVETYRARIADKLGFRSRTDLVRYALGEGWLDTD